MNSMGPTSSDIPVQNITKESLNQLYYRYIDSVCSSIKQLNEVKAFEFHLCYNG